jgi:hypothetical protein
MKDLKMMKRGQYIRVNGDLHCVTGRRQCAFVRRLLSPRPGITPITRWTGSEWVDTGMAFNWNAS